MRSLRRGKAGPRGNQRLRLVLEQDGKSRLACERRRTGEHVIEHRAEAIDIGRVSTLLGSSACSGAM